MRECAISWVHKRVRRVGPIKDPALGSWKEGKAPAPHLLFLCRAGLANQARREEPSTPMSS
jgi:hypothetical protein